MQKCTKCGVEFEGKFCPECGTAAVEPKVPQVAPTPPEKKEKPNKSTKTGTVNVIESYVGNRQKFIAVTTFFAVLAVILAIFILPANLPPTTEKTPLILLERYFILLLCPIVAAVTVFLFLSKKTIRFDMKKSLPSGKDKLFGLPCMLSVIAVALLIIKVFVKFDDSIPVSLRMIVFFPIIVVPLVFTASLQKMSGILKPLYAPFFGTDKPDVTSQCKTLEEVDAAAHTYFTALNESLAYPVKVEEYKYELSCYNKGKEQKKLPKALFFVAANKILAAVCAVLMVASIVVTVLVPAALSDPFRKKNYEMITVGDSKDVVSLVLGEAFVDPILGSLDTTPVEKQATFEYYSDNYMNIVDKMIKLEEKAEKLLKQDDPDEKKIEKLAEEIADLAAKMEKLVFSQITVTFASDGSEEGNFTTVASLKKEFHYQGTNDTEKEPTVTLSATSAEEGTVVSDIVYQTNYSNGNYAMAAIPQYAYSEVDFATAGTYTLKWQDLFGHNCEAEFTIT